MRTLGASRRQVLGSVTLEALVIGFGASVVGLFAGLGLAVGLNELFRALNLDLPRTETVFATRTIVVSLLVGTLVTLAAGSCPRSERRAFLRSPRCVRAHAATWPLRPLDPVHRRRDRRDRRGRARLWDAREGIPVGERFGLLGVGVLALFVGSRCSRRGWCGRWFESSASARRFGGRLGRSPSNAQRNPGRTAATAAALMIGIALVTFVSVLANRCASRTVTRSSGRSVGPHRHLADGYSEFPAAAGVAVAQADGVALASDVRQEIAESAAGVGTSPASTAHQRRLRPALEEVGRRRHAARCEQAVVPSNVAEDRDLSSAIRWLCARRATSRRSSSSADLRRQPVLSVARHAEHLPAGVHDLYDRPRNRFTLVNVESDETATRRASSRHSTTSRTRGSSRPE